MIYYNLQGQTALALLDPEDEVTVIFQAPEEAINIQTHNAYWF